MIERIFEKVVFLLAKLIYGGTVVFRHVSIEEIVLQLTLNTASLALDKHEHRLLAPIRGTCGPFQLSGNSLPVFHYTVFEKSIMEFIRVRVEVSKPDRIQYFSTIESTSAPELHGNEVETKEKYKEPFIKLARHLHDYFPLVRADK